MGASGWHSRVSYQDDIGAALRQARQTAYDQNDFYRVEADQHARSMDEEAYVAWGLEQRKVSVPAELADVEWTGGEFRDEWRAAQVTVTGPDSLLDAQPFSGAHSVIDMTHMSASPDYNAVAPAPEEFLLAEFGTAQPSVEAIEKALDEHRLHGFRRWHGMYLIGHTNGQPTDIFFVGASGD
jgi:hypothetical protein